MIQKAKKFTIKKQEDGTYHLLESGLSYPRMVNIKTREEATAWRDWYTANTARPRP